MTLFSTRKDVCAGMCMCRVGKLKHEERKSSINIAQIPKQWVCMLTSWHHVATSCHSAGLQSSPEYSGVSTYLVDFCSKHDCLKSVAYTISKDIFWSSVAQSIKKYLDPVINLSGHCKFIESIQSVQWNAHSYWE